MSKFMYLIVSWGNTNIHAKIRVSWCYFLFVTSTDLLWPHLTSHDHICLMSMYDIVFITHLQILMNVQENWTDVKKMHHARIQRDLITALVMLDIVEMDSTAQVWIWKKLNHFAASFSSSNWLSDHFFSFKFRHWWMWRQ